jgi:hypothetical protein
LVSLWSVRGRTFHAGNGYQRQRLLEPIIYSVYHLAAYLLIYLTTIHLIFISYSSSAVS